MTQRDLELSDLLRRLEATQISAEDTLTLNATIQDALMMVGFSSISTIVCQLIALHSMRDQLHECLTELQTLRQKALPKSPDQAVSDQAAVDRAARETAFANWARRLGAEMQIVTPEGFTQLPEPMMASLDLKEGGHLWFLQSEKRGRWGAYPEAELDEMFGDEDRGI